MSIRIGFIGYSQQEFDEDHANKIIGEIFNSIEKYHPIIVSGLTDLGIPKLVYREAINKNLKTVGIACRKAEEYPCVNVDEKIIIGEEWGDESQTFLDNIDILIKIGGGKQSQKEFNNFNGKKFSFKL